MLLLAVSLSLLYRIAFQTIISEHDAAAMSQMIRREISRGRDNFSAAPLFSLLCNDRRNATSTPVAFLKEIGRDDGWATVKSIKADVGADYVAHKAPYFFVDSRYISLLSTQRGNLESDKHWHSTNWSSILDNAAPSVHKSRILNQIFHAKRLARDRNLALFRGAWVDSAGLILNPSDCRIVRGGGCSSDAAFDASSPTDGDRHSVLVLLPGSLKEPWSFPMETMVALASIEQLLAPGVKYHVPKLSPWVFSWLDLVGIHHGDIVSGTQYADLLIAPEPAHCHDPYIAQLNWLHNKLRWEDDTASPALSVVYIGFNYQSGISNGGHVERLVAEFAKSATLNYYLVLENDFHSNLRERINIFSKASVVVAQQGLLDLFVNYMGPGSAVIELISGSRPLSLRCASIAYFRGISYHMEYVPSGSVDIQSLKVVLETVLTASKKQINAHVPQKILDAFSKHISKN